MTTTLGLPTPDPATAPAARARRRYGLWALQIALAAIFLLAGGAKLAGAPMTVATFQALGVGQWFRYVTGSIEVLSAVALLIPAAVAFGALALAGTMLGAVATKLFVVPGSPIAAAVLLVACTAVAWAHRDQIASVIAKNR